MSYQIRDGESKTFELSGKTFQKIKMSHYAVATAVDTPLSGYIDVLKWNIRITLHRGNAQIVLCDGKLGVIGILGAFYNSNYENLRNQNYTIIQEGANGNKEIAWGLFEIDLGSVVNLMGGDRAVVEVQSVSGSFGSGVDTATSYMYVDAPDAVGREYVTPVIKTKSLSPNVDNDNVDLGENVTTVIFNNLDKTSVLLSDNVIQSMSLSSDKKSTNDVYGELLNQRSLQFESQDDAAKRNQSFCLYDGTELKNAQLNLILDSQNVNSSQNYVVWRYF